MANRAPVQRNQQGLAFVFLARVPICGRGPLPRMPTLTRMVKVKPLKGMMRTRMIAMKTARKTRTS